MTRPAKETDILTEYDRKSDLLAAFGQKLELLVSEILKDRGIAIHTVSHRLKDRTSLERKVRKKLGSYRALSEVTDVVGVRVITYLLDDIGKIAKAVQEEFVIDEAASVDKRATLAPDRFGYLSLHYIVSLSKSRTKLVEYRRFPKLKAEIQIRTVLQHAWAEIEHDLGYKTEIAIPEIVRRRFSRLAGLLELADDEFMAIRDALTKYAADMPRDILETPQLVGIDKLSLRAFISESPVVRRLDEQIAEGEGAPLEALDASDDSLIQQEIEEQARRLDRMGITTVADLEYLLEQKGSQLVRFAREWGLATESEEFESQGWFVSGISIFYLSLYLAVEKKAFEEVKRYLLAEGISDRRQAGKDAKLALAIVKRITQPEKTQ